MSDLDRFACLNRDCADYCKKGLGNIRVYTRYGCKQVRLLICRTCGQTFSELNGTALYDCRLNWKTIGNLFGVLLAEKHLGIRAAARRTGLSKNTVKRYLHLAGQSPETFAATLKTAGPKYELNVKALEQMFRGRFPRYRHTPSGRVIV